MVDQIADPIDGLGISFRSPGSSAVIMELAWWHRRFSDDALYLDLALREGTKRTSLDHDLGTPTIAESVQTVLC